jgi:hypothetical protein
MIIQKSIELPQLITIKQIKSLLPPPTASFKIYNPLNLESPICKKIPHLGCLRNQIPSIPNFGVKRLFFTRNIKNLPLTSHLTKSQSLNAILKLLRPSNPLSNVFVHLKLISFSLFPNLTFSQNLFFHRKPFGRLKRLNIRWWNFASRLKFFHRHSKILRNPAKF